MLNDLNGKTKYTCFATTDFKYQRILIWKTLNQSDGEALFSDKTTAIVSAASKVIWIKMVVISAFFIMNGLFEKEEQAIPSFIDIWSWEISFLLLSSSLTLSSLLNFSLFFILLALAPFQLLSVVVMILSDWFCFADVLQFEDGVS